MITNIEEEVNNISNWIKNYVENAKANGVVIGNSGGKDSATVIALCTNALGKEKVLTVAMPCKSIKEDLEDAKSVAVKFDVQMLEINIQNTFEELEKEIEEKMGKNISDEGKINMKPRLRMTTLYAIAQTYNYLVCGTGNKCEQFVGYTTKWGDSASDFNPIANYTVDEVLQIGKYLGVPEKIISKAPNDGLGGKTDEEKMGVTYKQIAEYIETGKTDDDAMKIIERKHRVSEHKRKMVPVYERK